MKGLLCAVVLICISSCVKQGARLDAVAGAGSFAADLSITNATQAHAGVLKLLSLNVAHGRKDATNQIFVSKQVIEQNLIDIATVLKKQNADVVALQEADGPSRWSGNFDHVQLIAKQAAYPWYYRAVNAHSLIYNYGTAILSRWPVSETLAYNFKPSPPTVNKGFLLVQMQWIPNPATHEAVAIDIISVHLDFSRQKVRQQQITEMRQLVSERQNPLIILGDFNSEWFAEQSVVKKLAEQAKLKVYKPLAENMHTYQSGSRLDWVLISSELEFVSYKVLADELSDHSVVVAEIQLLQE